MNRLQKLIDSFNEALIDTNRNQAIRVVREALEEGILPEVIVFEAIIPALELKVTIANKTIDMSLAQYFMISQIVSEISNELIPLFQKPFETIGRIVIGNAQGDLHTLGKKIVMGCLRAQMIECFDLGVNVPAERFVSEALTHDAQVIGISAMMVHTARGENGCLKVRQILKEMDLEHRIKIIVGGAAFRFDPNLFLQVKADAWAADGISAGKVITKLIHEVQS